MVQIRRAAAGQQAVSGQARWSTALEAACRTPRGKLRSDSPSSEFGPAAAASSADRRNGGATHRSGCIVMTTNSNSSPLRACVVCAEEEAHGTGRDGFAARAQCDSVAVPYRSCSGDQLAALHCTVQR